VKPYRFLEEADEEFHDQIRYYDEQADGLGDRFIADVENVVAQICTYPMSGTPVPRNLRRRVLAVFKYNIFYIDTPDEVIIVAVAPHKRKPGYWRDRLKKPN